MASVSSKLIQLLAKDCNVTTKQVEITIQLLDDGNTVPFIARYRKHLTDSLDDTQLRLLNNKLVYFRELFDRKVSIINAINKQGLLTDVIKGQIEVIIDKVTLEHFYAPFKTTRVTKAKQAEEAGLKPLSEKLWRSPKQKLALLAKPYINTLKGFTSIDEVIEGALSIAIDELVKDVALSNTLKKYLYENATITSTVVKTKINEASKYKDYFDFDARINRLPAHRILAILRGKNEGLLRVKLNADPYQKDKNTYSYCQTLIAKHLNIYLSKDDHDSWHRKVIDSAWRLKLQVSHEKQFIAFLKEQADKDAIEQFAINLTSLLMASPAGEKVTLGLDPGFRSGCKLALINKTGKLIETATIYPHQPQSQQEKARLIVTTLIKKYDVELIAIGNGTASRESEQFISSILMNLQSNVQSISVSEAGASVYSASHLAAVEFPDLDVTLRGAVSIARRLQDPLSELVKIDPKAIGVGLYQHDVQQNLLAKRLQEVVEECVNKVGVDLNTASSFVLTHVAGLNATIAKNIVDYRDVNGRFHSRKALNSVPRLGIKAFQQSAGFLTVSAGDNCLDETILHPEQYAIAEKLIRLNNKTIKEVVFNKDAEQINILLNDQITATNGEHSDKDHERFTEYKHIATILNQPHRDPRALFKSADFDKNINKVSDLKNDMILQGIVTNVSNFGAFVDVGVHQDGLVHISMLHDGFVDDPYKIVKVGQIVNVKVMDVDQARNRISLSMKSLEQPNR